MLAFIGLLLVVIGACAAVVTIGSAFDDGDL